MGMSKYDIEPGIYSNGKTSKREVLCVLRVGVHDAPVTEATWLRGEVVRYRQLTAPHKGEVKAVMLESFARWAKERISKW